MIYTQLKSEERFIKVVQWLKSIVRAEIVWDPEMYAEGKIIYLSTSNQVCSVYHVADLKQCEPNPDLIRCVSLAEFVKALENEGLLTRPLINRGDRITICGVRYQVCQSYLVMLSEDASQLVQKNDYVFDKLGLEKRSFVRQTIGYPPVEGIFPSVATGDYVALQMIIEALETEYNKQHQKPYVGMKVVRSVDSLYPAHDQTQIPSNVIGIIEMISPGSVLDVTISWSINDTRVRKTNNYKFGRDVIPYMDSQQSLNINQQQQNCHGKSIKVSRTSATICTGEKVRGTALRGRKCKAPIASRQISHTTKGVRVDSQSS